MNENNTSFLVLIHFSGGEKANMKPKYFATIILASLLIVTVFGSVTVFAPQPTTPNPNAILDAFITNTSDDPVPVDITDTSIDVNLNEPIEVTLDEPIEVMGMETTYWDTDTTSIDPSDSEPHWVSTEGYKEITLFIENDNGDAVTAGLYVICSFRIFDALTVDGPSEIFIMDENRFAITYKIISNQFFFNLINPSSTTTVENLEYGYYLTT